MNSRLKSYEYSAFGEPLIDTGPLAATFTHQFSTKPYCAVTGFSEYVYRKCRPEIGRWMSRDPVDVLAPQSKPNSKHNILHISMLSPRYYTNRKMRRGEMQEYSFVNNWGVCLYDYLGLVDMGDDHDQICKSAEIKLKPRTHGNLICHNGKPYACAWDNDDEKLKKYPHVKECTQKHEDVHLGQNVAKACCGTNGTFIPDYPGGLPERNKSECDAYNVSVQCLKENMLKDCGVSYGSGYDPFEASECVRYYDFKIDSAIDARKKFCKRAVDNGVVSNGQ